MSRAAILPTPGDPFLLNYWLKYFKTRWYNSVDKLYIYYNSPIQKPVVDFVRDIVRDPKINFVYNDLQVEHGTALDRTLDIVPERHIMFVEDDCFILKPELINLAFEMLERREVDVVGSKRGSCSLEISLRAKELWGLDYEGEGDQGCNFWPNLFFTRKEVLLATDRNFGARAWSRGEVIKALGDYIVKEEMAVGDTLVNTSLQLRAMGLRFYYLPQYHGSPDDLEHYEQNRYVFDGKCPWFHVGSLSSGVSGVLMDDCGRSLARMHIDPAKPTDELPNYCNTDGEKREWERRVQMWLTAWRSTGEDLQLYKDRPYYNDLVNFYSLYGIAIERLIRQYHLSQKNIERRIAVYKVIGTI